MTSAEGTTTMQDLDLRRDAAAAEYPGLDDLDRLDRAVRARYRDLPEPLALAWSDSCVLALDRGVPWVYGPVERDPMTHRGRTVVPRALRRELAGREGPFRRMAVAHQIDPAGVVAPLLPVLRSGPRRCTDAVARAVCGPVPPHPGTARALHRLDGLVRGTARATAAAADVLLDPILFGIVARGVPVHGEPVLWYPLVAWRW